MNVFLSSTKQGVTLARQLANDLSQRGFKVWFDAMSIRPGEAWALMLADAITSADAIVVVVAPDSSASQWQSTEVALAMAEYQRGKTVIPVLATEKAEIPYFVRQVQAADLSSDAKYEKGIAAVVEALRAAAKRVPAADALRAQQQVLEARKLTLEITTANWFKQQAKITRRVASSFVVFLTLSLVTSGIFLFFQVPQRGLEYGLVVTQALVVLSAMVGYLFGRRVDRHENSIEKQSDGAVGFER